MATPRSEGPRWDLWLLGASALAGIAVLGVLAWPQPEQDPLAQALAQAGLDLDIPPGSALLRDAPTLQGGRGLELQQGQNKLTLDLSPVTDIKQANTRIADQAYMLESLFYDRQAPYPGQLSNTLRCPEEFLPEKQIMEEPNQGLRFSLFANDRMSFGGCSRDLLSLRAVLLLLHCPASKQLVRLEAFTPIDSPDEEFLAAAAGLRCAH